MPPSPHTNDPPFTISRPPHPSPHAPPPRTQKPQRRSSLDVFRTSLQKALGTHPTVVDLESAIEKTTTGSEVAGSESGSVGSHFG